MDWAGSPSLRSQFDSNLPPSIEPRRDGSNAAREAPPNPDSSGLLLQEFPPFHAHELRRWLLPHQPLPLRPGSALEDAHRAKRRRGGRPRRRRPHPPSGPRRRLRSHLVLRAAHPRRAMRPLRRAVPVPLQQRARRATPPRRDELPLRPVDLVAAAPPVDAALPPPAERLLPPPVVGLLRPHRRAGREDLRAVVHRGEAVPGDRGEPDEPDDGDREPGRGGGGGADGVEGERGVHVCCRRGALPGAVRDAVPEAEGERVSARDAAPGVLPLLRRPEHGELGLGLHLLRLRRLLQDALLPLPLPLHVPGFAAGPVQEIHEKVQRSVVGVLLPADGARTRSRGVRAAGEGSGGVPADAGARGDLSGRDAGSADGHGRQVRRPASS